ncbi:lipid IV(A) palmitoyltransferase PagP [Schauerella aestuarii]|uniref:lipid IV(A) palmitoyltransferase PagP n=1 Tax=Schauerella aestuarii TaxID=2511204 RepID=UPI00136B2ADD|nr:lipid IV(A) palmitoyltransferase PagP [Achromobacter aestuarii]MYZ45304.1 lipid IV(A) palmitoyltransferase PagP [Achromobacter aestuarii]
MFFAPPTLVAERTLSSRGAVAERAARLRFRSVATGLLLAAGFAASPSSQAQSVVAGWYNQASDRVSQVWTQGDNELYLTGYAWHNRWAYSRSKVREFNETSWGGGFGKGLYDEDGDWHGLYAMAFKDSHDDWQPMAGYGYQSIARPTENTRLGAGFTVFMTARRDIMSYVPFPGILPLVSAGYKKATLFGAYVPGKKGNGNVAFIFGKYTF